MTSFTLLLVACLSLTDPIKLILAEMSQQNHYPFVNTTDDNLFITLAGPTFTKLLRSLVSSCFLSKIYFCWFQKYKAIGAIA